MSKRLTLMLAEYSPHIAAALTMCAAASAIALAIDAIPILKRALRAKGNDNVQPHDPYTGTDRA
jgi:hypothetical protein